MPAVRVFDDRKRAHDFLAPPRRVVSLVPSDTLNVAALGCGSALVGRTDYCDLPVELAARVPTVGGTKNPRLDDIVALEPDLVLANQEENTRGDLEALAQRGVRVYVAFPRRVADGLAHLAKLARAFRVAGDADVRDLMKRGYDAMAEAERANAAQAAHTAHAAQSAQAGHTGPTGGGRAPVRTFCPIWMDPLMTIHGDTFISDMLVLCGAANVFADRERRYPLAADLKKMSPWPVAKVADRDVRYPRVTLDEVVERAPELVLLPDEPHPFTESDADVFRALAIPAAARGAVTLTGPTGGKDLSWYGARSVEGIPRLRALIDCFRQA